MSFPIRKCLAPSCANVLEDGKAYCSTECQDKFEAYVASMKEQQASEKIKRDYELIILEVQKIELQPGDVLMTTIKSDYTTHDELRQMSELFKIAFPQNKAFLFNMGSDGDVKFAVVSQPEAVPQPQSAGYCSDCDCGKRERVESKP